MEAKIICFNSKNVPVFSYIYYSKFWRYCYDQVIFSTEEILF